MKPRWAKSDEPRSTGFSVSFPVELGTAVSHFAAGHHCANARCDGSGYRSRRKPGLHTATYNFCLQSLPYLIHII